ncbi:MAG: hypothetical protein WAQ25_02515, partial [Candidatus Saccharimonas sp.]
MVKGKVSMRVNLTSWKVLLLPLYLAVGVFLYTTPTSALATVPYKMNFQGRLTDTAGTVKPDGTYNIRFRIYNSAG